MGGGGGGQGERGRGGLRGKSGVEVSIAEGGSHPARADTEASVEALFADCDARRQQRGQQRPQGRPAGGTAEAPWAEVSAEPPKKQFKEAAKAARIQQNNAKERKKLDKLLLGDPESKDQATKDGLQQTVVNALRQGRRARVCPVLGPDPTGPPYFITGPAREAR